jgi:hypothetical protein
MKRETRGATVRHWKQLDGYHNYRPSLGEFEPAMSFEEIGRRLGIGKKHAYMCFARGIRKLRRNPATLFRLLALADSLADERGKREARGARVTYESIQLC